MKDEKISYILTEVKKAISEKKDIKTQLNILKELVLIKKVSPNEITECIQALNMVIAENYRENEFKEGTMGLYCAFVIECGSLKLLDLFIEFSLQINEFKTKQLRKISEKYGDYLFKWMREFKIFNELKEFTDEYEEKIRNKLTEI